LTKHNKTWPVVYIVVSLVKSITCRWQRRSKFLGKMVS